MYREQNRLQKENESLKLTSKDAVTGRHGAAIGNGKTRFKLSNKRCCKKEKKKSKMQRSFARIYLTKYIFGMVNHLFLHQTALKIDELRA